MAIPVLTTITTVTTSVVGSNPGDIDMSRISPSKGVVINTIGALIEKPNEVDDKGKGKKCCFIEKGSEKAKTS